MGRQRDERHPLTCSRRPPERGRGKGKGSTRNLRVVVTHCNRIHPVLSWAGNGHSNIFKAMHRHRKVSIYTICSSSRAYARFAAMSFCVGISTCSSFFFAKVIMPAVRSTCQPRCKQDQQGRLLGTLRGLPVGRTPITQTVRGKIAELQRPSEGGYHMPTPRNWRSHF